MGNRLDIPIPEYPLEVVFVLVKPAFSGNIGAVCRGMLNFGFNKLRVIGHEGKWDEETRKRAKHAQSVLDNAEIHENWESCMQDISLVIGTSGKRELGSKIQFRHFLTPNELITNFQGLTGRVAIVFGPENSGLSNQDLRLSDLIFSINTNNISNSLNLSHAVAVICHKLFELNQLNSKRKNTNIDHFVNKGQLSKYLDFLFENLSSRNFFVPQEKTKSMKNNIYNIYLKSPLTKKELQTLWGITKKLTK